jgi:hypothetical protein
LAYNVVKTGIRYVFIQSERCGAGSALTGDHAEFCEKYEGFGDFCACNATIEALVPSALVSFLIITFNCYNLKYY